MNEFAFDIKCPGLVQHYALTTCKRYSFRNEIMTVPYLISLTDKLFNVITLQYVSYLFTSHDLISIK